MIAFCRFVALRAADQNHIPDFSLFRMLGDRITEPCDSLLKKFSKENEADAWDYISKIVSEALDLYPADDEEDEARLKEIARKPYMKTNEKNCILYRYSERVILNYLKDCAIKVYSLV